MNTSLKYFCLALGSAVLLSAGFLFPHCGGFALIGFVPLLWMDKLAGDSFRKHFFHWYYLSFLLWNTFTTFWVCNATVAGGIAACTINALEMAAIWGMFRLFKRRSKGILPYIFLACAWIAWERAYYDAEISWPWLTLGNAFARSSSCIQWYEVTGTIGGSLWVWACNITVFLVLKAYRDGSAKKWNNAARTAVIVWTVLVTAGPLVASWIRYATLKPVNEDSITAVALQPNIDPYHKFEKLTQYEQNSILTDQIDAVMSGRDTSESMLLLGPETFTSDVIVNNIAEGQTINELRSHIKDYPNCNLLFGASSYKFFYGRKAPSYTARRAGKDCWYEDYNSALMIDRTPRIEIYHKSRLVIGTEKMPWPKYFSRIEKAFGGNICGHCIGQEKVSLLNFSTSTGSTPLGCAVCYESIYPEHFASYVAAGARAMTVITNDAWWGDTPGYVQHLSYSKLRAIETRRDIARCANTGISAFINQRGDIVSQSDWWKKETLEGKLHFNSAVTPFVKYGDITGRVCSFVFLLLVLVYFVSLFGGRRSASI